MKPRITDVPLFMLMELAVAFEEGNQKHSKEHFRTSGRKASEFISAALRHIILWWEGTPKDETGQDHLVKAVAQLMMCHHQMKTEMLIDDRHFLDYSDEYEDVLKLCSKVSAYAKKVSENS